MFEPVEARLRELARRAGLARVPTPVLVAGMALLTVAVVGALVRWWPKPDDSGGVVVAHAAAAGTAASAPADAGTRAASPGASTAGVDPGAASGAAGDASGSVCVDVVGAVRRPGVYHLAAGQRVTDAVDAAGGPAADAATDAINLAAPLQDGTQIAVPTKAQVKAGLAGGASSAGAGAVGAGGSATSGTGSAGGGAPVDLNSADAAALDALPGIGPSTAAKIVADRSANGRFKSVDDLGRVSGIGPKKLDQLRPLVCVR